MSPAPITSLHNPKLKDARALLTQRKARAERQAFVAEGIHHVGAAVEAGADIESIFYAPDLLASPFARQLVADQQTRRPCYPVSAEAFTALAEKDHPQGLLAVVRQVWTPLAAVNHPWNVALVRPQDPGNVGSVLRTMNAVGAGALMLVGASVDVFHPGVVRASLGAIFYHPLVRADWADLTAWARTRGHALVGTDEHAPLDYRALNYPNPCVLVMGSEREGLTPAEAADCTRLVRLPMQGRVTSLNLAAASAVMLYAMRETFYPDN